MKKNLFFVAAVSALMLTACSSENDVVQNTTPKTTVQQKAVGFDVYTQQATGVTRAGLEGTMTTSRMQRSLYDGGGFGVYGFLTEDAIVAAGDDANATSYTPTAGQDPNYMVNQMILWNATNQGWYYNPLKYWPNETDHDSQSTNATMEGSTPVHLDRLTFFAYAPYVEAGSGSYGITKITDANGQLNSTDVTDPSVEYTVATTDNLDQGVDLLWGVAPAGGLSYTAVNGWTVTRDEGKPLINMIKPDVNTNMKFLFEHALARIGVTIVSAIDQVSPGGTLDPNTKITVNKLTLKGRFGDVGILNLNNGTNPHVANWTSIDGVAITGSTTAGDLNVNTLTVNSGSGKGINPHLQYTGPHTFGAFVDQNVVGVTTTKQDLLTPSTKWFTKLGSKPAYNPGKKYYSDEGTTPLTASYTTVANDKLYTETSGTYSAVAASTVINAPAYPAVNVAGYYILSEVTSIPTGTTADPYGGAKKFYTKDGNGIYTNTTTFPSTETYYIVEARPAQVTDIPFAYADAAAYYEAERNYFMIVPTNNVLAQNSSIVAGGATDLALRTIQVQIEYYITTKDANVSGGYTQTKNVITKDVLFPSLANGKSYNLNIVLGLTSVKLEAEVDDWKVINVQADLPQNTAE